MATPDPTPTDAQIEIVSEITLESTDTVSSMIAAYDQDIADAKWARTLTDITTWEAGLSSDAGDVKKVGEIEFFEDKTRESRLDFRNKVRRRYGKTALVSDGAVEDFSTASLEWF